MQISYLAGSTLCLMWHYLFKVASPINHPFAFFSVKL
jgi:hypothetical protein